MATLVGRRTAVISDRAATARGLTSGAPVELVVSGIPVIRGTIGRISPALGLATIDLSQDVPFDIPSSSPPLLQPGATWASMIHILGESHAIEGRVLGPTVVEGVTAYRLSPGDFSMARQLELFEGGPIVIEGTLAGVVVFRPSLDVLALPIDVVQKFALDSTSEQQPANAAPRRRLSEREIFERLSLPSREALNIADAIRRRVKDRALQLEYLLLGLTPNPGGPVARMLKRAGIEEARWTSTLTGLRQERPLPAPYGLEPRELTGLMDYSGEFYDALAAAIATSNGGAVEPRHLLYGALTLDAAPAVQALRRLGIRPDQVDLGPESGAPVDAKSYITRLLSDGLEGKALLGIDREVDALCSVLASTDVEPPISVGLFGNWGSGKSFFMRKMEDRFNEIRKRAQKEENSPWCANIVQVKFNAWHYIDTNLWANLTSEVFEGLSAALVKSGDHKDFVRERLLAVAANSRDILGEAERKKKEAEEELRAGEQRLKDLQVEADRVDRNLNPGEVLREVFQDVLADETVDKELKKIAKDLNIPEVQAGAQAVKAQILELRGIVGWLKTLGRSILHPENGSRWVISVAAVGVAVLILWGLPVLRDSSLSTAAKNLATALATISAFVAPFLAKARRIMASIDRVRKDNEKRIAGKKLDREVELEAERKKLTEKVTQAQKQVDEAAAKVKEIEKQLEELQADRQLYKFVQERHESKDYTQYLGLIAKARSDFERLTALMKKVKDEKPEAGRTPLPRIDRIILYIDDLDRCPEPKVVDVLQAVHLLLAFPLFVVVVGVDPRWLLHSLKQHSVAFRPKNGGDAGMSEEELEQWRTTPLNYLEKIFQIPYTLRPMSPAGFNELIDQWKGVAEKKVQAAAPQPVAPTAPPERPAAQPAYVETSTTVRTSTPVTIETQRIEIPEAPLPEPVPIEPHEWEFIKKLGPMIPTPRGAKRFVNVYRLLRASMEPGRRSGFVESEYKAAQMLLALVMGHPEAASEIVGRLIHDEPSGGWWDFVEKFRPGSGDLALAEETGRDLFKDVDAIKAELPALTCEELRGWAPDVARYSFRSGRILLETS